MERKVIICWAAGGTGLLLINTVFLFINLKVSWIGVTGAGEIGVRNLSILGEVQEELKKVVKTVSSFQAKGKNEFEYKGTGINGKKYIADESSREPLEKGTYSIHANIPTSILFVNKSGKKIKIYWLDYSGNRKLYKVLEKDQVHSQQTYVTHPWLIAGDDDRAMRIYFPDSQSRTVIFPQSSTNPQQNPQ